jgi:hypothetical protein
MSHLPDVTINERSSAQYTSTLLDETGDPVAAVSLEHIYLSLRDVATGEYINGREDVDVLGGGSGVTVHATSGLLTWDLEPDDNAIVTPTRNDEMHEAVFNVVWDSGQKAITHRVLIKVKNLQPVA